MKKNFTESLRMHWFGCGMPLGGLGTGTVDICPDGLFREWNIMNNQPLFSLPNPEIALDSSFFGILADGQAGYLFEPRTGWERSLNDPYETPYVKYPEIKAETSFPEAYFDYRFEKSFPVRIKMTAWSSFIPHDVRNSAIPGAYFDFTVQNLTGKKIQVSLFHALRNLTSFQKCAALYSTFAADDLGMTLTRKDADPKAQDYGSMSIGMISHDAEITRSYCCSIFNVRDIWEPLFESGILELNDRSGKVQKIGNVGAECWFDPGKEYALNAATASFQLKAGEIRHITFIFTWHFPNLYEKAYPKKKIPARRIGHRYNLWYSNSCEVMHDLAGRRKKLQSAVREYRREMTASGMEKWLVAAIDAQLTTFFKSSWLDEKGRFAIWEGLGHCGLDTVDVSLYGSVAVQDFFPELELSQLELLAGNSESNGAIAHLLPGNFHCSDVDIRSRLDRTPDFMLLYWRDVIVSGDIRFAGRLYPVVRCAIETFRQHTDEACIPYHLGKDQTYDQFPIKGSAPMTALLYAAGLAGVSEIAALLGKKDDEKLYDSMRKKLLDVFDERFWNGSHYSLSNDLKNKVRNEGVMVDACVGDWFRRSCGENSLTDEDKLKKTFRMILRCCTDPAGFLRNCAWPDGNKIRIPRHTANQADWPWTGVEYAFAAELVFHGMVAEALSVVRNVFDRYERVGMRCCHIECGPHYYRAMSIWSFFRAWTGFTSNVVKGRITLDFTQTRKVFILSSGIRGIAEYQDHKLILTLKEESFPLREIVFRNPNGKICTIQLKNRSVLPKGKLIFSENADTCRKNLRYSIK